jgi:glycosyltransferase involved in cell wall biosynthesis
MKKTVLHLLKRYRSDAPLINSMVPVNSTTLRTVACYLSGTPDGKNGMEQRAEKTHYFQLPGPSLYWYNFSTVRKVAKLIDDEQVDLIVCQFRRVMPISALAARFSRRKPKVVGVMHGLVGGRVTPGKKVLNYFTYRQMEKLVSVSQCGVADILKENIALPRDKVVAIQNGIVCEPFTGPAERSRSEVFGPDFAGSFVFSMVGRLAPKKNHFRVIKAFSNLAGEHSHVRLVIAGSGPEQQRLEQLVQACGLGGKVHFLGQRKDVPDILKHSDVFLFPSIHEGLPLALMEAMVAGCPVLTSRAGGLQEIVTSEEVGLLVDPVSEKDIESGMRTLISMSPDERRQLGAAARQHILTHFTDRRMAEEYDNLYREVLGVNG